MAKSTNGGTIVVDEELQAMNAIAKAFGKLENPEARKRVLQWVNQREQTASSPVANAGAKAAT